MSRLSPARSLLFLSGVLLLLVAATAHLMPFTHPETGFWINLQAYLATGHVTSTFLPGGYPQLAGLFFAKAGPSGVVGLQALLYCAVAAVLYLTLRETTGKPVAAALAAFVLSVDPDLLASIPKLWDTEISVLFVSGLAYLCLRLRDRERWTPWLLGATWGLSLSVRPNLALMALPIAYAVAVFSNPHRARVAATVLVLAVAVLAATNTVVHGSFYLPQNGPYNFFAGANPYTVRALLDHFNAEPSLPQAMADHGIFVTDWYTLAYNADYTRFALQFLAAHPLEWLWIGVVKLFTLLRPDTKAHALLSAFGLSKLLTALATPVWLVVLLTVRRFESIDRLMLIAIGAYILPFLLTDADPRFRVPLDVLVLTHAAMLLLRDRVGTQHVYSAAACFGSQGTVTSNPVST